MTNKDLPLLGIKRDNTYNEALYCLRDQLKSKSPRPILTTGLCQGATDSFFVSLISDMPENTFVFILPNELVCSRYERIFSEFGKNSAVFPYRDFIFHNITSSKEFEHKRLSALSSLISKEVNIILTTPEAAVQYTLPQDKLRDMSEIIDSKKEYNLEKLEEFLISLGYTRHEPVDGAGQFTVRGGILDIFSTAESEPVRIEFFGEEIDTMSYFDPLTQRRTDVADIYRILPAREIPLSPDNKKIISEAIKKQLKTKKVNEDEDVKEALKEELNALDEYGSCDFSDKYISCVYDRCECLLDYADENTVIVVNEYTAVHNAISTYTESLADSSKALISSGLVSSSNAKYSIDEKEFDLLTDLHACLTVNSFLSNVGNRPLSGLFNFKSRHMQDYGTKVSLFREDLENYIKLGYEIVVFTENEKSEENLAGLFDEYKIKRTKTKPKKGAVMLCNGPRFEGYDLPDALFAFLSIRSDTSYTREGGIIKQKRRRRRADAGERIMSYADITEGDYVVHEEHGIGIYEGITSMNMEGITKDYLKIKYAGTDTLYIPCDNLQSLSKYIGAGAEDGNVRLSRLGGGEWERAKQKASKSARDMAKKLISLYAERMRRDGFAFPEDDDMQLQFESEFVFDETDGQLDAIEDIKKDMMAPHPMDRLLCGDVGFGKTEVALRAAFKAAMAGKQTAILAPTTLLALQHYNTIVSRMRAYPIKIEMISRMVPTKKQKQIIESVKKGTTDIIVGTHRLISHDIEFYDLGLLIVDEEQRFGVAQKEKLKEVAKEADVLTLTATPIPRTLNMAMSGIRDMSILEEAPGNRLPVQTYVMEYDENVIADALRRELSRGGQVFYLYNRVKLIERKAVQLSNLVPGARIAVAHGQMDKDELSDLWHQLVMGKIDIMVCTTIIETGVDVPNANTLIIENADRMGLAQLHQIRGRVGRSPRRAYAYFTYPKGKVLTEDSEKRLSAIREYTEFGSGFKVALRDLEIRGAGNILGSEQHGHIASIGYDMYMKILNDAILEEEGKLPEKKKECTVDLSVNAFLPKDYLPSDGQRIDFYRKIAGISSDDDLSDVTDELIDRYGEPPAQVMSLLKISFIRFLGERNNFKRIEKRQSFILFRGDKIDFNAWSILSSEKNYKGRIMINASDSPYVSLKLKPGDRADDIALECMKKYSEIKESREGDQNEN